MGDAVSDRVVTNMLAKAAEIYASGRKVGKALPEFESKMQDVRRRLVATRFENDLDGEPSPAGGCNMMMALSGDYPGYDVFLDMMSISEAAALGRNSQISRTK